LPYDPVIPLLSIYAKEIKTGYSRDACTLILIAALFTIAKLWRKSRCPITDEWTMKLLCICTKEYHLATRNNDMGFEGKWMQLEDMMFSEVSLDRNTKDMFSLIHGRLIQR
jgi:hypothetical protein